MAGGEGMKDVTPAGCVFAVLYMQILMLVSAVAHGYALVVLWSWFIIPLFHLPPLTIPQALGVGLVAGLLTKEFDDGGDKDESESLGEVLIKATLKALIRPAFALLFGWVILKCQ